MNEHEGIREQIKTLTNRGTKTVVVRLTTLDAIIAHIEELERDLVRLRALLGLEYEILLPPEPNNPIPEDKW